MNLKKYLEMIETKRSEMRAILDKANAENRALTKEERETFDKLDEEVEGLNATVNAIQTERSLETPDVEEEVDGKEAKTEERSVEDIEKAEERAFEAFLRGEVEDRADDPTDTYMTKGANGAVVPTSIANKIIDKVVEISPVFAMSDRYNVKGTLQIPYYDATSGDIVMEYADEFTDGVSTSGKFSNISLTGFLARAICDVSKSLINNSQFDIVNFVINKMAQKIAIFIEGELLNGTENKITGLSSLSAGVTTATKGKITADELIDLQETVPDVYQSGAIWIMNRKTRKEIRKIRDGEGNYILNRDLNARWGYTLLGKEVYTSDNMGELATASSTLIYYGDLKGLAVKVSEDVNIDVLFETKARQHAVEVLGFVELDSKVQNAEMLTKMVNHA
jgi:HK97 family phage major capsid protein